MIKPPHNFSEFLNLSRSERPLSCSRPILKRPNYFEGIATISPKNHCAHPEESCTVHVRFGRVAPFGSVVPNSKEATNSVRVYRSVRPWQVHGLTLLAITGAGLNMEFHVQPVLTRRDKTLQVIWPRAARMQGASRATARNRG